MPAFDPSRRRMPAALRGTAVNKPVLSGVGTITVDVGNSRMLEILHNMLLHYLDKDLANECLGKTLNSPMDGHDEPYKPNWQATHDYSVNA